MNTFLKYITSMYVIMCIHVHAVAQGDKSGGGKPTKIGNGKDMKVVIDKKQVGEKVKAPAPIYELPEEVLKKRACLLNNSALTIQFNLSFDQVNWKSYSINKNQKVCYDCFSGTAIFNEIYIKTGDEVRILERGNSFQLYLEGDKVRIARIQ